MNVQDRLADLWDADLTRLLLLCAALGLAVGWFSSAHAPSVSWGDVPTWIAAVAAGLALYFATAAARAVRRLLLVEQARENRREAADADRRTAAARAFQADRIGAWHQTGYYAATLRNGSTLPVYDVAVEFVGTGGDLREQGLLDILPPGDQTLGWTGTASSPQDGQTAHLQPGQIRPEEPPHLFRVAVTFRDTAGSRWRRDERGLLTRLGGVADP
jgi:hypothetical protein